MKAAGLPASISTLAAEYEASTAGANAIALSWTAPSMEEGIPIGYKVFRNNGDGGAVSNFPDPTCGLNARPAPQRCTITGLQRGRRYTFQISAINEIGEGPKSTMQEFISAAVPAKVSNVISTSASLAPTLRFQWDAPNDRGAYIYNYDGQLQRLTDSGVILAAPVIKDWEAAARGGDVTNTFVELQPTGFLHPVEEYRFRVRAYNEMGPAGTSDWGWSDWSASTWTLDRPNIPTNVDRAVEALVGRPVSNKEISIGWQEATYFGGDIEANVKYEVYAGLSPSTMTSRGTVPGTMRLAGSPVVGQTHWFTLPGLDQGMHVFFQVYAWNRGWRSLQAVTPHKELIAAAKPSVSAFAKIVSTTTGVVDMTWNYPSDDGGAPIIEYEIVYGNVSDAGTAPYTITPDAGATVATMGYTAGSTTMFHIRARNNAGYSSWDSVSCCPYTSP